MTSSYEQRIIDAVLRHSEAIERNADHAAAAALTEALSAAKLLRVQRREPTPGREDAAARELHKAKVKVSDALFELDGTSLPSRVRSVIGQQLAHALQHAEHALDIARKEGPWKI